MRRYYKNHKLTFYIGDVRDQNSVDDAVRGVVYVFHAAALKQVINGVINTAMYLQGVVAKKYIV
jgi:FlaA1/EpsC-like NDP-sugar epimerase